MISGKGTFQYDPKRGVLYFYEDQTGECLLRVEGVRDVPAGAQIDIHLVEPGCEHHHLNCGNRGLLIKGASRDPGMFCATKIEGHSGLCHPPASPEASRK